jgi:hypothetical protein
VPENLADYLQSAPLPSFPAKLSSRRPAGKENSHQILRLKLKSPDLAETSFIMSTIEEEIEGVNMSQTSQELLINFTQAELISLGPPPAQPPTLLVGPPAQPRPSPLLVGPSPMPLVGVAAEDMPENSTEGAVYQREDKDANMAAEAVGLDLQRSPCLGPSSFALSRKP